MSGAKQNTRTKLLDAALKLVREKGYAATRVDDVCEEAGVTKGAFFHHFASKDDLGLAAVAHWDAHTTGFFAEALYHRAEDPLDRLLAYVDFRKQNLAGEMTEITCFAGTMVQEVHATHPEIRAACKANICDHAKTLEADIRAAMRKYKLQDRWTAESLALHTQSVVQGALLLAKAAGDAAVAAQSLNHLRRYLELLFAGARKQAASRAKTQRRSPANLHA